MACNGKGVKSNERRISQGLIAFYVGRNKTTISRWEKGQINISLELYEKNNEILQGE